MRITGEVLFSEIIIDTIFGVSVVLVEKLFLKSIVSVKPLIWDNIHCSRDRSGPADAFLLHLHFPSSR